MCMFCSYKQAIFVEIMHLANSTSSINLSAVESKDSAGAPETEIEVTPAMIDAGLEQLFAFDHREDDERELMANIFRAMSARKLR
jgi:hypothetical protein